MAICAAAGKLAGHGARIASETVARIVTTTTIRTNVSVKGSAKGMPYLEPIKPVLHNITKMAGANVIQEELFSDLAAIKETFFKGDVKRWVKSARSTRCMTRN